jgi:hypothetical protein
MVVGRALDAQAVTLKIREPSGRIIPNSKRPTRGSIATDKRRAGEWFVALALRGSHSRSSRSLLPGPSTKQRDCEVKI